MTADTARPALLGGEPIRPQGPPDWPIADDRIRAALERALRDGSWGKYDGGEVRHLEARLQSLFGVKYALTCGSGTFAVELALRSLQVGLGAEVILAAYDFSGNFLNVLAVGATPVLIDVDPDNWNMSAELLGTAIGPATKAVIVSHLHGGLAPMREIREIANLHSVPIIEDAAQAPGATVQGRPTGSWGDVGVLSFGGSKLLSAGRGGAILTNRADVHQRAKVKQFRGNIVCPLSELQAAVLVPQLDLLSAYHQKRLHNVAFLTERLRAVPGLQPFRNRAVDSEPGYYKVGFQYDAEQFGLSRVRFVQAMRAEGVALDEGFPALHMGRSPNRFRQVGALTEAEKAHSGVVVLHHPVLLGTEADVEQVAQAIEKVWAFRKEVGL